MRIIICVKQICHTYARTGMDPEKQFLAPEDRIYRINPYDEVAIELALRTKERLGAGKIIILTLGPLIAEAELRRCLAMGADDLYHIDTAEEMDSWSKSRVLARAIRDTQGDLVLCGKESLDNQSGQTGAFISQHLAMPFVSAITDLTVLEKRCSATVQRKAGRGVREVIDCPLPAVFSVDLGPVEPRIPTYSDKKQAWLFPIRKLSYENELKPPKIISTKTFPARPRPKKVPTPVSTLEAYYRIQELLIGSRIQKSGEILRGDPKSQVERIIAFLQEHGFLESGKAKKDQ
jgi:electron transfer flavoprotein beta subunit